jgi:hypothetical protein
MPLVARKSPTVNWIGDGFQTQMTIAAPATPGLYGTLIHP